MPNIMKTMATICECHMNAMFQCKLKMYTRKTVRGRDGGKKNPISKKTYR